VGCPGQALVAEQCVRVARPAGELLRRLLAIAVGVPMIAATMTLAGERPSRGIVPEEEFHESVHPEDRERVQAAIARGGDEFAVLLPKADRVQAAGVAQTLVEAVRNNIVVVAGERKSVTTSIGVMVFDDGTKSVTGESILIEADLAMYDAKEAGRDRFAFSATSDRRPRWQPEFNTGIALRSWRSRSSTCRHTGCVSTSRCCACSTTTTN
jgi:hypothetical protein